jgi:ABC-type bacteriocin/lantibiotic exporter with double-glycine peptidase domain
MKAALSTPVIYQAERADCGPACLAMVLAAHGKNISLERIKTRLRLTNDGIDAFTLLKTGKYFGLKGRGVEANLPALHKLPLPAILHWGRKHYVVLVRLGRKWAHINDPGAGKMKLTMKEFQRLFSGTVLLFE